ncbi:hypothetical protein XFF6990_390230 [Xanthomonas citri pv. fuscans]|nr:hypothetical protein XFF6990_390230 [Xanthomonas citri pv. fuscans]
MRGNGESGDLTMTLLRLTGRISTHPASWLITGLVPIFVALTSTGTAIALWVRRVPPTWHTSSSSIDEGGR